MNNTTPLLSKLQKRLYFFTIVVLAVTGFGQMPIFKRYYIADIPGLGWTADFYFTHKLHYIFAAVLLFLIGMWAARWFQDLHKRYSISVLGYIRIIIIAGIVITGFMRVMKNLSGWFWDPFVTMVMDWTHLGLVMLLGAVTLAAVLLKRSSYVHKK